MFNRKEYVKKYYQANREKVLKTASEHYLNNREKILERRRLTKLNETPEQRQVRLATYKKWRDANKDKCKANAQTDGSKYSQYINAASRRDHSFEIEKEDFVKLFHGNCEYCGTPDARGIDRVKNNLGYTLENSRSCCEKCNKMKWCWTREEFIEHINLIANNQQIIC